LYFIAIWYIFRFAVFDGHAGSRVSAHCSDHLLDCISSVADFKDSLRKEHTLGEEELIDKVFISCSPVSSDQFFAPKITD
jgi:serine/threonine protein phosphatase PrpC